MGEGLYRGNCHGQSEAWRFLYRVHGRTKTLCLGLTTELSEADAFGLTTELSEADAFRLAAHARRLLQLGLDPLSERQLAISRRSALGTRRPATLAQDGRKFHGVASLGQTPFSHHGLPYEK
jgi:hypothetical protein